MIAKPNRSPNTASDDGGSGKAQARLFLGAQTGRMDVVRHALNAGADASAADPLDGQTALHIAVGTNNFELARYLIEQCNAGFGPDGLGRWPSVIAIECKVSDDFSDYIAEKESAVSESTD
ncbi:MAG: ankyrin repeat domain-containing protein [Xanthobacteraceae bacterium]